jgi:zeaxanthin glucosyltransferase
MVAIPIANDQPGVAARIVWAGAGEVVSIKHLNVATLRDSIQRVLTEDSYRKSALNLQKAIQQAGESKEQLTLLNKL